MTEPTNGNYVTWRELNLLIGPFQTDITEIKGDVKLLLNAHAGNEALSGWQRWFFGAMVTGALTAVATLVWLATS